MFFWSLFIILIAANSYCDDDFDQVTDIPRNLKKPTTKFYYYWKSDKKGNDPPSDAGYRKWQDQMVIRHIVNLTNELYIDMEQKFRETTKFINFHRNSPNYVMGMIASNIKERFKKMLRTYRLYANYSDLVINFGKDKRISSYIDGYMEIDSDYNELSLYNNLFIDSLEKTKARNRKEIKYDLQLLDEELEAGMGRIRKILKTTTAMTDFPDYDEGPNGTRAGAENSPKSPEKTPKISRQRRESANPEGPDRTYRKADSKTTPKMKLPTTRSKRQPPDIRIDDSEYKSSLRKQMWDRKYGHFDPKLEGIDIDLEYV